MDTMRKKAESNSWLHIGLENSHAAVIGFPLAHCMRSTCQYRAGSQFIGSCCFWSRGCGLHLALAMTADRWVHAFLLQSFQQLAVPAVSSSWLALAAHPQ